ncbi:hypothetical protein [Noviherbaspirillum sedimenti]|uniref:SnoaL-like domain-containing protein n=1 Tax=Noviherbaspirillum sedimenti TaxID=2320865 RepID=A0A3A3G4Z4_9BURK|nr:hypothetical protein [Noviherbaspirillum sedimenti]RJG01849.1 hypothetical protein D3878_09875 [Noviherbaspirillum sedimenti]
MKKTEQLTDLSRRAALGKASKMALSGGALALLAGNAAMAAQRAGAKTAGAQRSKNFTTAEDWVTAFFNKGADVVLGYYDDKFIWEDIEFGQTIATKEELHKAFLVFNNSGPESPFGVHKFEMISYDGGVVAPGSKAEKRKAAAPADWNAKDYKRLASNILLGADFEYDEWGYMQWVWQATHNEDFFGIPAKGKTTYTRGTTTQFYRKGKIVRCRTHWNFREFAIQLGVIPAPDEKWRSVPNAEAKALRT